MHIWAARAFLIPVQGVFNDGYAVNKATLPRLDLPNLEEFGWEEQKRWRGPDGIPEIIRSLYHALLILGYEYH